MLQSSQNSVLVGTTSTLLIGASPNRCGLIISSPKTNPVTISNQNPAVDGFGITLRPDTDTLVLSDEDTGDWIKQNLYAISVTAAEQIGFIEVMDI